MCVPLPHEQDTNSADTAYGITCLEFLEFYINVLQPFPYANGRYKRLKPRFVVIHARSHPILFRRGPADQTIELELINPGEPRDCLGASDGGHRQPNFVHQATGISRAGIKRGDPCPFHSWCCSIGRVGSINHCAHFRNKGLPQRCEVALDQRRFVRIETMKRTKCTRSGFKPRIVRQ